MNNILTHAMPIAIRSSETDRMGLLRTDATANYMEDIANEHAELLGVGLPALLERGVSWAMSKVRIHFHRRPAMHEKLLLSTHPLTGQHQTFLREFTFKDSQNNICISAVTWWVVFDLMTRKMTALPNSLNTFPQSDTPWFDTAITVPPIKNAPDQQPGPVFSIRLADIDQNNHVNNVKYLCFIEEAGQLHNRQASLQSVEAVFRAEAHYGDTLTTITAPEKSLSQTSYSLLHNLQTNGTELLRARTVWHCQS